MKRQANIAKPPYIANVCSTVPHISGMYKYSNITSWKLKQHNLCMTKIYEVWISKVGLVVLYVCMSVFVYAEPVPDHFHNRNSCVLSPRATCPDSIRHIFRPSKALPNSNVSLPWVSSNRIIRKPFLLLRCYFHLIFNKQTFKPMRARCITTARHGTSAESVPWMCLVTFAKIVLVQIVYDVSQINTSRNIVSRTSPSASRLILLSLDIALCGAKRSRPAFSLFQAEDFLRFFFFF